MDKNSFGVFACKTDKLIKTEPKLDDYHKILMALLLNSTYEHTRAKSFAF
ncbi:hypothetical protein Q2Y29_003010 [Vibrio alginolyticus]|nr:hypothetical protein [Vibrio alginolyticus]